MLASAGTLLPPGPEQASCLQPPPSSTSAIGRRMLQDPPARPTLSIAAQSGKGLKPSLGNHSNSMKFLLLTPLPPSPLPPLSWLLSRQKRSCACPGLGRGSAPCPERTNPDSPRVRTCFRPRTLFEIHMVAYAVVQTACK